MNDNTKAAQISIKVIDSRINHIHEYYRGKTDKSEAE